SPRGRLAPTACGPSPPPPVSQRAPRPASPSTSSRFRRPTDAPPPRSLRTAPPLQRDGDRRGDRRLLGARRNRRELCILVGEREPHRQLDDGERAGDRQRLHGGTDPEPR